MSGLDERAAIVAGKLSLLEADLLCGRCEGWGSWMFTTGGYMVSLGLGTSKNGNIQFDTPLADAVRDHLANPTPGVTKE